MQKPDILHIDNLVYLRFAVLGTAVCKTVPAGGITAQQAYSQSLTLQQLRTFSSLMHEAGIPISNERGEWTADFVDYGLKESSTHRTLSDGYVQVVYVSNPRRVWKTNGRWRYAGGTVCQTILPPDGWVIPNSEGKLYDLQTGLPFVTTPHLNAASISNYAYFWRSNIGNGLLAVNRECERMQGEAFEIAITQQPDFAHDNIGHRPLLI